jgi:uncharacterized damage-inducible protein DinB
MKVTSYINQLQQVYAGGNWVEESFEEKLKHLSDKQLFSQPYPGIHSVAELVWHCAYWRRVTLTRLNGQGNSYRDSTLSSQKFLSVDELKAKGWNRIKQELEDSQIQLINLLQEKTDAFLENEYEPNHTYEFVIEGTIQHDYYHLGQIGLVIRILKERSEAGA